MSHNLDLYDTSDYPQSHELYSTTNKKRIGKMKDEMNSVPIREFHALRPKMYHISVNQPGKDKKVAKGVSKAFVKNHLTKEDYSRVLFNGEQVQSCSLTLRSNLHEIYTTKISKLALDSKDSKRVVLADRISTLPYGHYLLDNAQWCKKHVLLQNKEDNAVVATV